MGFNLSSFFEEMLCILNNAHTDTEKLEALKEEIEWQHNYAKQCNQL